MSTIIASIGISLLATLILYVLNYNILGKTISIESGSDGYDYKVSARHYFKAYILSALDMIIFLTFIFVKETTEWKLFKAVGISVLFTIGAIFVSLLVTAFINIHSKNEPDEKTFNSMELEIANAIYESEKMIIPSYIFMTLANGILLTVILHILKIA